MEERRPYIVGVIVSGKEPGKYALQRVECGGHIVSTLDDVSGEQVVQECLSLGLQVPSAVSNEHFRTLQFWKRRARLTAASVTPRKENNVQCRHAADYIRQVILEHVKCQGIVLSGSYTKGTQLRYRNEVDLIILIDPHQWQWTKKCYEQHLRSLIAAIYQARREGKLKLFDFLFKQWSISFTLKYNGMDISVDIVVASMAPSHEELAAMSERQRKIARTSFTQLSFEEIILLPPTVKDGIRLLKLWRKQVWMDVGQFPSYVFELLAYNAYKRSKYPPHVGCNVIFRDCVQQLAGMTPGKMLYIPTTAFTEQEALDYWNPNTSTIPIMPDIVNMYNNVASIGSNLHERQTLWARVRQLAAATLEELKLIDRVYTGGGLATRFSSWRGQHDRAVFQTRNPTLAAECARTPVLHRRGQANKNKKKKKKELSVQISAATAKETPS